MRRYTERDYDRGYDREFNLGYDRGGDEHGMYRRFGRTRDFYTDTDRDWDYGERRGRRFGRPYEDVYEPYDRRSRGSYRVGYENDRGYNRDYELRDYDRGEFDRGGYAHEPKLRRRRRREGPYSGMGPKGYRRSEDRIVEDVCEGLTWESSLDASDIQISVSDGEVTLEGTVDSRRDKRLAEDLAENVRGVRDIHNRLTIRRDRDRPMRNRDSEDTVAENGNGSLT